MSITQAQWAHEEGYTDDERLEPGTCQCFKCGVIVKVDDTAEVEIDVDGMPMWVPMCGTCSPAEPTPPTPPAAPVAPATPTKTRKPSKLRPRFRAYSERKVRELTHTVDVLTEVKDRLNAEGEYTAAGKVMGMISDVLKAQRRVLGVNF